MRKALRNYIFNHVKQGPAPDLGKIEFRSSWERNFARILNHLGITWAYEPKRFWLGIGTMTYLPDFALLSPNPWNAKWIEIKGIWKRGDKEKIRLFLSRYKDETLKIIASKEYRKLTKQYSKLIPLWEGLPKKKVKDDRLKRKAVDLSATSGRKERKQKGQGRSLQEKPAQSQ